MTVDRNEAPKGFYAVSKQSVKHHNKNICEFCDARQLCVENKDNWCRKNRCMSDTMICFDDGSAVKREDGESVIFKRVEAVMKIHNFEIYVCNPETGKSGWDIHYVSVKAKDWKHAKERLENEYPHFDCVVLKNYQVELGDDRKEAIKVGDGFWRTNIIPIDPNGDVRIYAISDIKHEVRIEYVDEKGEKSWRDLATFYKKDGKWQSYFPDFVCKRFLKPYMSGVKKHIKENSNG